MDNTKPDQNYECAINNPTPFSPSLSPINMVPKFDQRLQKYLTVYTNIVNTLSNRQYAKIEIEKFLVKGVSCKNKDRPIYDELSYNMFMFDSNKAEYHIIKKSSPNDIYKTLACAVQTVLYSGDTIADRFHEWFSDFNKIGGSSTEGLAVLSSFGTTENKTPLFVLKTPLNIYDYDLYHEATVGFYGLNPLKSKIPNFMYVYGITDCNTPLAKSTKDATGKTTTAIKVMCSDNSPNLVPYLITENIFEPNQTTYTLYDFINRPEATIEVVCNLLFQVINALYAANLFSQFTHYDLHTSNILVHKTSTPISIKLDIYDNKYLRIDYIATIIDYGFAHINIGGIGYGKVNASSKAKVDPMKQKPEHDIYKLLGFLGIQYNILATKTNNVYTERANMMYVWLYKIFLAVFNMDLADLIQTYDTGHLFALPSDYVSPRLFSFLFIKNAIIDSIQMSKAYSGLEITEMKIGLVPITNLGGYNLYSIANTGSYCDNISDILSPNPITSSGAVCEMIKNAKKKYGSDTNDFISKAKFILKSYDLTTGLQKEWPTLVLAIESMDSKIAKLNSWNGAFKAGVPVVGIESILFGDKKDAFSHDMDTYIEILNHMNTAYRLMKSFKCINNIYKKYDPDKVIDSMDEALLDSANYIAIGKANLVYHVHRFRKIYIYMKPFSVELPTDDILTKENKFFWRNTVANYHNEFYKNIL